MSASRPAAVVTGSSCGGSGSSSSCKNPSGLTVVLVVLAFSFAWSIGSHYTGACMGMPYSLGAVSARTALLLMAPLALVGATFASGKVATTVGRKLVDATPTRLGE